MRSVRRIACLAIACAAWPAVVIAGLRTPQVPIASGALQNFFNAHHVPINASTDQLDMQTFSVPIPSPTGMSFTGDASGNSYGIYNGSFATPPLYLVWPGA